MTVPITTPALSLTMEEGKHSICVDGGEIQVARDVITGWLIAGVVLLLALVAPLSASADTTQKTAAHVSLYKELLVLVGDAQAVTAFVDTEKKRVEDAIKKHLGVASFTGAQQKKFDAAAGPVYREAFENTLQDIASAEASHFTADEIKGLITVHSLPAAARYKEVKYAPVLDIEKSIDQYLNEAVASIIKRYKGEAGKRPNLEYDWSAPVHKLLMATGQRAYVENWAASYLPLLQSSVYNSLGAIDDQDDGMRLEGIINDESLRLLDWFIINEMEIFSHELSPRDIADLNTAFNTALAGVAQKKLSQMQNGGSDVSRTEIFKGHLLKAIKRMEAEYRQ